ncbi:MAG TPA: SDR family NAD(P)-dependent oxidoreductase [Burkholderiaceae bacterium]|nr:SDR family NAD(P)-dependent oxidoreductase [Burkholderiaceae bacterium]
MSAPGTTAAWSPGQPLIDLSGKVVVVSGGGSVAPGMSIGRAACVTYARLGAMVCVQDLNLGSAEETVSLIRQEGGQARAYQVDLSSESDLARGFSQALDDHGRVDVLHYNVGLSKAAGAMDTSTEDLNRIHAVNVTHFMLACRQVLPGMVERQSGSIISISSIAGMRYLGYPHLAYNTTKAALIHMTRMIAHEYAAHGIRANTVVPGLIDTPRVAGNVANKFSADLDEARDKRARQVPMQRMGTPWEIANACAFLASDAASYITGTEIVVDGGITGKYV